MNNYKHIAYTLFVLLIFSLSAVFAISTITAFPLWWDEGWTLTVARTWVEQGHYGMLLNGEPAPAGLTAAFPTVASIALSFKLFGVGIWQGRLPGVLYTLGSLFLLYYLVQQLYNRKIAIGTLVVLLMTPMNPMLHPLYVGQQVLAEMPMIFYLLLGYTFFFLTLDKSLWFLPFTFLAWGMALLTKAQPLPFWILSLLIPAFILWFRKNRHLAILSGISLIGSLFTHRLLLRLLNLYLEGRTIPQAPLEGLYEVSALVLVLARRIEATVFVLIIGLPSLLAICYAWQRVLRGNDSDNQESVQMIQLSLLTLSSSWFAWYWFLSVAWVRYLFPATFFSALFVMLMLQGMSHYVKQPFVKGQASSAKGGLSSQLMIWQSIGALLVIILIFGIGSFMTWRNVFVSRLNSLSEADDLTNVVTFLHGHTEKDALIESYDSELFFLLNRPYHYPPDQLHVELNRGQHLEQTVPIEYDPLSANPDYVVVGGMGRVWQLYDDLSEAGQLRLLSTFGQYDVYERVRE